MPLRVNKKDALRMFRHMDQMRLAIASEAGIAAEMAAKSYADLVKSGIGLVNQTPPFVPGQWEELGSGWKKIKTANKEKFWLETGGILNSIRITIISRTLLFIHVFAGMERFDDSEAFFRALRNEYGAKEGGLGAARPLFGPAIREFVSISGRLRKDTKEWSMFFLNVPRRAAKRVYVFSGGSLSGRK